MAGDPVPKTYRPKKAPKRLKRSHGSVVPAEVREALWRRCGGACEVRAIGCWGHAEHPHHRRLKAQGVDHSLANLLAVCAACHRFVHANVAESQAHRLHHNPHQPHELPKPTKHP